MSGELPSIPELDLSTQGDDEAFLFDDSNSSQTAAKRRSSCKSLNSPVFFPGHSPTYITKLKLNKAIQDYSQKSRGVVR